MEIETFLGGMRADPELAGRLLHVAEIPPRPARFAPTQEPLTDSISEGLARIGVERLYEHQARAIDAIRAGEHLVIATGTASGKSLCYNIPVIEAIATGEGGTALYLFPTKALAQDQMRAFRDFAGGDLVAATYDGDTPHPSRSWIRQSADLVLTNPDMLHFGILPNHEKWSRLLSGLRYVVLDELHTLRGVFGSHVACLVRRLRRVARQYGADPTFVAASATIGRPELLGEAITGLEMRLIGDDASPSGRRFFAILDTPVLDEASGRRSSSHFVSARLMAELISNGLRVITFSRSRRAAEVVARGVRDELEAANLGNLAGAVRSYRGGYLAEERREIERQLFGGELAGIAATNALELGIDAGDLDVCIIDAFPGTIASLRQQMGRAGRRTQDALAVLVAGEDALDRWYGSHPDELLTRPPEVAVVNPVNPLILRAHLGCAAAEIPLVADDVELFGDEVEELAAEMVGDGDLISRGGRLWWARPGQPAHDIGLRSSGGSPVSIVDAATGATIGTEDADRAPKTLHDGAVYLHSGELWVVDTLDLAAGRAWVEPFDGDYYTMARVETDIRVVAADESQSVGIATIAIGEVEVVTHVTGYKTLQTGTGVVTGYHDLALPPATLVTKAFWLAVPRDGFYSLDIGEAQVTGAMHAIEHAGISVLPLFMICDRSDIGGVSMAAHPDLEGSVSFIYDGYAGGTGIAELGYQLGRRHLEATLQVISTCGCADGCPSCIQSPKCGNFNEHLEKEAAVALLREIVAEGGSEQ